jgi:hypothetical protein
MCVHERGNRWLPLPTLLHTRRINRWWAAVDSNHLPPRKIELSAVLTTRLDLECFKHSAPSYVVPRDGLCGDGLGDRVLLTPDSGFG